MGLFTKIMIGVGAAVAAGGIGIAAVFSVKANNKANKLLEASPDRRLHEGASASAS